jgi:tricorn protease
MSLKTKLRVALFSVTIYVDQCICLFMKSLYFQRPALSESYVGFVHGDALWVAPVSGGVPRRITDARHTLFSPAFSPNEKQIAFVAAGDVYVADLNGCTPKRVTFLQSTMRIVQWKDDHTLILSSSHNSPFRQSAMYTVNCQTGQVIPLHVGPCAWMDQNQGACVIQRHGYGYTSWKGYKGGTAGQIWIDKKNDGQFQRILDSIDNNLLHPLIINDRLYFLSDLSGMGHIHSCTLDGQDVRQHTHHTDFYVQDLSKWRHILIYSCGGQILTYDTRTCTHKTIAIDLCHKNKAYQSVQRAPDTFLSGYAPAPDGKKMALITRGRLFEGTPHKGPLFQRGESNGVRYRWVVWLKDKSLVTLCDQGQTESLSLFTSDDTVTHYTEDDFKADWGRLVTVKAHPHCRRLACTNHRHDLFVIDLDEKTCTFVTRSERSPIHGYDWSPCGQWLVYSISNTVRGAHIGLYHITRKTHHHLTDEAFFNTCPVFDREGRFIFFLSNRTFQPEWDDLSLNMVCHDTTQPFAITLQKDARSPFVQPFFDDVAENKENDSNENKENDSNENKENDSNENKENDSNENKDKKDEQPKETIIDLEGIDQRVVVFPLPPKAYSHVVSVKGHLLYTVQEDKTNVYAYDLGALKEELWVSGVESMALSANHEWMMYVSNRKLRLVKADAKPDDGPDPSFRQGGWVDWNRVCLNVIPQKEWAQMFDEAWRLQKDMFWMPSMGNVDWQDVYARYRPCIDRASCLSEVEDIIASMQGELGTSHAYVMGHKRPAPSSASLGAQLDFVPEKGAYRIGALVQGDPWTPLPLQAPGLNIRAGDLIWSVAGHQLSSAVHPLDVLQRQSGNGVPLVISDADGQNKRTVAVFPGTKKEEREWCYRQWVTQNRAWVHENSQGRAGYVHIPDMQAKGYGEFLRGYMQEFDRPGLIIDARYNGGGNISYLIMDFLTRRRLGYDQSRHQGSFGYPSDAPHGPMVALVNEYTGSDGDIFSHAFKTLQLGPTVGKRTWGGVVGIWPRYSLIDGTMTSQPEYSFWFHDGGWTVENKGVEPTIDVDITPQDYIANRDTQMERGLAELEKLIKKHDPKQDAPPTPCLKRTPRS